MTEKAKAAKRVRAFLDRWDMEDTGASIAAVTTGEGRFPLLLSDLQLLTATARESARAEEST